MTEMIWLRASNDALYGVCYVQGRRLCMRVFVLASWSCSACGPLHKRSVPMGQGRVGGSDIWKERSNGKANDLDYFPDVEVAALCCAMLCHAGPHKHLSHRAQVSGGRYVCADCDIRRNLISCARAQIRFPPPSSSSIIRFAIYPTPIFIFIQCYFLWPAFSPDLNPIEKSGT